MGFFARDGGEARQFFEELTPLFSGVSSSSSSLSDRAGTPPPTKASVNFSHTAMEIEHKLVCLCVKG